MENLLLQRGKPPSSYSSVSSGLMGSLGKEKGDGL